MTTKYFTIAFWLGLAGMLFAGYLSGVRLLTQSCAFNEPCPFFLGYRACWFGFVMFSVLFVAAAIAKYAPNRSRPMLAVLRVVSLCGILFAGYFTLSELSVFFAAGLAQYALILPTCAYGLIFYALVFGLSFTTIWSTPSE